MRPNLSILELPESLNPSTIGYAKKKRKPEPYPVTIIIGFAYKDGINVASDSQMTAEDHKSLATEKVFNIAFQDGHSLMLANAGDVIFAAHFRDVFQQKAKATSVSSADEIVRVIDSAAKEARDSLLIAYHHPTFEPGSGDEYLSNRDTIFLFAFYFGEEPYLYYLRFKEAKAIRRTEPFVAIGSGRGMANFILSGFDLKQMALKESMGMAAYAIEMCVRHDPYCGGRLQLGTISKHNGPSASMIYWSPIMIEGYMKAVASADSQVRQDLPLKISAGLDQNAKELQALKDAGLIKGPFSSEEIES